MKRANKLLALVMAMVMAVSMLPGVSLAVSAETNALEMYYDDRLSVEELGGTTASNVSISNQKVTSSDSAVLTYVDGNLIATGIGTATVTVDGKDYPIEVTAAPISLIMITGHSIGAGQAGVAAQSVKNEAGQVYSTHGTGLASASAAGVGLGYSAASRPEGIDGLTTGGGVIGEAGGLAYRWNQLTGEKVWVLNTSVGGTSLYRWIKGADCYTNAIAVYKYAQTVLQNEIAAGHFILKNQAIIYHSAANWGYKPEVNGSWNLTDGKTWYDSMLNGFKTDLARDMDGDGKADELDGIGFVPIYTTSSAGKFSNDVPANFFMGASEAYGNVFMASVATSNWVLDISSFPNINYPTQGQSVTKPTAASQLFASDGVHLSQVAYNAAGMDIAKNLYENLRTENAVTSVAFKTTGAANVSDEVVLAVGESISLVPLVTPLSVSDLSFSLTKNLSMTYPMTITGESDGMGKVTVSQNGNVVATLNVAVGDTSVPVEPSFPEGWSVSYHCVCGNPDSKNNPCAEGGHTPVEWKPWTITNTVPFLDGYWYLVNDLDLRNVQYKYGSDFSTATGVIGRNPTQEGATTLQGKVVNVYVDLNGKTVTGKSGHRIFRIENDLAHSLTVCDTAGGGKLIPTTNATNGLPGMVFWLRAGSGKLTVYGGTFDASNAISYSTGYARASNLMVERGTSAAIYGGNFIGGTAKGANAQGGTVWNGGTLNIYGGTIRGGTANGTSGAGQGGNVRNEGTMNLYGGTLVGGTVTATAAKQGGNLSNVGTLKIYGGTIIDGTATGGTGGAFFTTTAVTMYGGTIKGGTVGSASGSYGGSVFVYGGNFRMEGGLIQAGSPTTSSAYRGAAVYVRGNASASFTLAGGTVAGGKVVDFGGAIGTETNGTINIESGVVTSAYYADGTPIVKAEDAFADGAIRISSAGATIGTWNGTINITGGTVIGGTFGGAGGACISVHGATKLYISGGLITGATGTSANALYGGAVSVYGNGAKMTMTGGTITGNKISGGAVLVRNNGVAEISGDAVIDGNFLPAGSTCNLNMGNVTATAGSYVQSLLTVGTLGENAKIGVSMFASGVFTANAVEDATGIYADSGYTLDANEEGKLMLVGHESKTHCVCAGTYDDGCNHEDLEGVWKPWDGKSDISEGGNYYLTQSLSGSGQRWMGGTYQNTTPMTINLCLNGFSIDSNGRAFGVAPFVTFNLMNCHEVESVVAAQSSTGNSGRVVHLHTTSSIMTLYGNVTLKGKEHPNVVMDMGGVINCSGTFNLCGGTLIGTWVGGLNGETVYPGLGGVARISGSGKFNIYAGEIYGGSGGRSGENKITDAENGKFTARSLGGVAYVNGNGQFNVYGGTIYGGSVADGGVVYANGANARVNISGGTIYAGDAAFGGGAIKMENGAKLTMTGGVIDGLNPERPRDIRNAGPAGGGAILVWNASATIKGNAVIRNCITSNYGGAIKVGGTTSTLTLGGNVKLVDNATGEINNKQTDNVYLSAGSQIVLDGLTTKAQVGIKMAAPGVFVAEGATEEMQNVFVSDDISFRVSFKNGALILGGAPVVAGSNGYNDLASALAAVSAGQLITLNESQSGDVTIPVSVSLDLNGNDIEGNVTVAEGAQLQLIDSATADYTAENRGMVKGDIDGDVAIFFNTPAVYGNNYKYLVIHEDEGWSAHRVYLAVVSVVLNPYSEKDGVASAAVNYKTVFKCNEVVTQYVDGYGLKLAGDNTVYATRNRALSYGADSRNEFVTKLDGVMKTSYSVEQNNANANAPVTASAYILLADGTELTSLTVSKTLKELVATVNTCNTLNESQQTRLGQMYGAFKDTMDTWTDIYFGRIRICYAEKVLGQPIVADKHIALTFDDGPNKNNSMEDVMDILDSYNQKATFFLIGNGINAETAPVVKDAYDRGFELGNHSYSHTRLNEKTVEEAVADWQKCQDLVAEITGEAPVFFRYPFNATNQTLLDTINTPSIRGYAAGDYEAGVTAEIIAQRVIEGAADGNIILLHVSKGYDWTENSLHIIIPELRSLGYEITTVGGLFEAQGVDPYTGVYINNVAKAN